MLDLEEINTSNAIQTEKKFIRNKRFQFFFEKKTTKQAVFKCSFQSRLLPILKKMHPCPQVLNLALTKLRLVVIYDYNMFPAFFFFQEFRYMNSVKDILALPLNLHNVLFWMTS